MKSRASSNGGIRGSSIGLILTLTLFATSAIAQEGPVKVGVLTDMSSLYADNGGQGSVVAAQMAVDDFKGKVLGRQIQIVASDHQNKADVGSVITRRWLENENVEVILDVPNSAVALAVQGITREKKKIFLATGAATSRLTGDECSMTGKLITRRETNICPSTGITRANCQHLIWIADGSLGIAQTDAEARAHQTAKNYTFFGASARLIVTIDRRLEVGSWIDLGMFIQNVMLAAAGRGLQSCPQETFAKYHRILRSLLSIPDEQMVVCGISIGCAKDEAKRLMPRADVHEFASFAGFEE
jgi:branched-chain amino acid transport system substrate-binding protein